MKTLEDMRLLAVDDSIVDLRILQAMLSSLAIKQVYTAKSGREALDFLGSCDDLLDVVVCDWNMPSVSGLDVLRQLRSVDPDLPFIMLTATAAKHAVIEAGAAGVTSYIVKPYSQSQLAVKLKAILQMMNLRNEPVGQKAPYR